MNKIRCFCVGIFLAFFALPSFADKLSLTKISAYLNTIGAAEIDFSQINDDGSIDSGRIFLKRPGRIRFEYDPPNKALVLASGGQLAIFDPKGKKAPVIYPLRRTPLSIILSKTIDLAKSPMLVGHFYNGTVTIVRAQDRKHPDRGSIDLVFDGPEPRLRQWAINDSTGGTTTVLLGDIVMGIKLKASLFSIVENTIRRKSK
jgi:outer membrane lipoprotein-sorting protein